LLDKAVLEALISMLFFVAHLVREFRAVFIVCYKVLCCLALFLVEVYVTTSSAYISILILVFLMVFGRLLMYVYDKKCGA
jgi:hypothetical protein